MSKCLINNNIRTLRFMAGEMTQQELADRTGVTRQTIVAIENGKYSPTLELALYRMYSTNHLTRFFHTNMTKTRS